MKEFHQDMLIRSKLIEKKDQRSEVEAEWAPEIKRCFFAVADQIFRYGIEKGDQQETIRRDKVQSL